MNQKEERKILKKTTNKSKINRLFHLAFQSGWWEFCRSLHIHEIQWSIIQVIIPSKEKRKHWRMFVSKGTGVSSRTSKTVACWCPQGSWKVVVASFASWNTCTRCSKHAPSNGKARQTMRWEHEHREMDIIHVDQNSELNVEPQWSLSLSVLFQHPIVPKLRLIVAGVKKKKIRQSQLPSDWVMDAESFAKLVLGSVLHVRRSINVDPYVCACAVWWWGD